MKLFLILCCLTLHVLALSISNPFSVPFSYDGNCKAATVKKIPLQLLTIGNSNADKAIFYFLGGPAKILSGQKEKLETDLGKLALSMNVNFIFLELKGTETIASDFDLRTSKYDIDEETLNFFRTISTQTASCDALYLADVLKAQYKEMMLSGVSYGTLLAQTVLKNDEKRLFSRALLSGALAYENARKTVFVDDMMLILKKLIENCKKHVSCKFDDDMYSRFSQNFYSGKFKDLSVKYGPFELSFEHLMMNSLFRNDRIINKIDLRVLLVSIIKKALDYAEMQDNFSEEQLNASSEIFFQCCTKGAFIPIDEEQDDTETDDVVRKELRNSKVYNLIMARDFNHSASVWLKENIGLSDYLEPYNGNVPMLIVQGEFDTSTPFAWGQELLKQYENAALIKIPIGGHKHVFEHPCGVEILTDFIEIGAIRNSTIDCLNQLPTILNWDPLAYNTDLGYDIYG